MHFCSLLYNRYHRLSGIKIHHTKRKTRNTGRHCPSCRSDRRSSSWYWNLADIPAGFHCVREYWPEEESLWIRSPSVNWPLRGRVPFHWGKWKDGAFVSLDLGRSLQKIYFCVYSGLAYFTDTPCYSFRLVLQGVALILRARLVQLSSWIPPKSGKTIG